MGVRWNIHTKWTMCGKGCVWGIPADQYNGHQVKERSNCLVGDPKQHVSLHHETKMQQRQEEATTKDGPCSPEEMTSELLPRFEVHG